MLTEYTAFPYYRLKRAYESGLEKPDVVLIPGSVNNLRALILEYKMGKDAEKLSATAQIGLIQISKKRHATKIDTYASVQYILVGNLTFYGKEVALASKLLTNK